MEIVWGIARVIACFALGVGLGAAILCISGIGVFPKEQTPFSALPLVMGFLFVILGNPELAGVKLKRPWRL